MRTYHWVHVKLTKKDRKQIAGRMHYVSFVKSAATPRSKLIN